MGWVGFGRVTQNGPMDNSDTALLHMDGRNGVRRRSTIDAIKRQQLGAVEGRLGQCYTVDVGQW